MATHSVKGHKIQKKQGGKRMSIEHLDDKSFATEVHHPDQRTSFDYPGPAPIKSSHPDLKALLAHVTATYGGKKVADGDKDGE